MGTRWNKPVADLSTETPMGVCSRTTVGCATRWLFQMILLSTSHICDEVCPLRVCGLVWTSWMNSMAPLFFCCGTLRGYHRLWKKFHVERPLLISKLPQTGLEHLNRQVVGKDEEFHRVRWCPPWCCAGLATAAS